MLKLYLSIPELKRMPVADIRQGQQYCGLVEHWPIPQQSETHAVA